MGHKKDDKEEEKEDFARGKATLCRKGELMEPIGGRPDPEEDDDFEGQGILKTKTTS